MQYAPIVFVLLVSVIVRPVVLGVPVRDNDVHESCEAQFWSNDLCSGTVSVRGDCKTATLNFAHTNMSEICTSINFFWSYPIGNLTIIIETPFTIKQQNYMVQFDNDHMMGAISNVYRLIDGKETEVTTTASKLIQYADSNYQVVLKLQGPPNLFYYGVFIDYEVAKS
ncbi:unnamed protein product [Rotaria socialis]|uniref:Uncharacterized protein n=1 Tax=Rotaria socialis TaxID=392032 RepID=A0A817SK63_9BILA|nr:unnamed protein product [Rotaria socialis]CAF3293395.1 unnamed protein product [Rotaria socialis]CAF4209221.1 unnamed protein product [Rotaria socialis]